MPDPTAAGDVGTAALAADCDAFWHFSCNIYARPGVTDALLALQDESGGDVNLALLCLWFGSLGRTVDAAALADADRAVAPMRRGVLRPLREARRRLKQLGPAAAPAYRQAKDLELAVERLAQHELLHALSATAGVPAAARSGAAVESSAARCMAANLAAYAVFLGIDPRADGAGPWRELQNISLE